MKTTDILLFTLIFTLMFFLDVSQVKRNRELQTQIDELRIVVDQKFLPAMILDQPTVR